MKNKKEVIIWAYSVLQKKERELQEEIEQLRSMLSPEGAEIVDLQDKIAHLKQEITDTEQLVKEEQKN